MTDTEQPEVTADSLLSLAADFDAGKNIDAKPEGDAPKAPDQGTKPELKPDENKGKEAATDDKQAVSTENKDKDHKATDEKQKSKWARNEERKSQTWQEVNAEKERIRSEREALAREREEFQRSKVSAESLKDEHGATAKDYRDAAKQFLTQGQKEMAEACDKLAANLDQKSEQQRAERTHAEGQQKWKANLDSLTAKNPDLANADSELTKTTLAVLNKFPLLRKDPDGISYAVRAAEIELQARDFDGTKAEFAKLKEDHAKLQKKLTISGGAPTGGLTDAKSFDQLSAKEMRQSLEQAVQSYDRDNT